MITQEQNTIMFCIVYRVFPIRSFNMYIAAHYTGLNNNFIECCISHVSFETLSLTVENTYLT